MYKVAGPARQVAVGGISSRGLLPFTGPLRLNGADLKRKLRCCTASPYFPGDSRQISGAIPSQYAIAALMSKSRVRPRFKMSQVSKGMTSSSPLMRQEAGKALPSPGSGPLPTRASRRVV